jgi:hypothetical protein
VISHQGREKMSVDGACLTCFIYHIFVWGIRHSTFCLLSLHFPVYSCVHDYASVDYPGIYHRSTLRYGHRPVSESTTVSFVTPPFILWGEALMALLALSYAHVWHIVPVMGILCENTISGISLALGYVLSKLEYVVSSPCYCIHV